MNLSRAVLMIFLAQICGSAGRMFFSALVYLAGISSLSREAFRCILSIRRGGRTGIRWRAVFGQMVQSGIQSLPIVFLIMLLIGMILSMQSIYQLRRFGLEQFTSDLVGVSFFRELAPLVTAIMISARVGAAIAAELGTMKVSEEILALDTLALSPCQFLVVPRLLALLVSLPCITVFGDVVGLLGGALVGKFLMDMPIREFVNMAIDAILLKDFLTGLTKSVAFGGVIAMVACYEGLSVKGGAEGVGRATTRSVVNAIVLIVALDLLFTAVFFAA